MSRTSTKTWLITGCSSGFGRALAEAVLARGDRVMLTARDPERLGELAARYPKQARAMALDVTKTGEAHAVVEATAQAFGGIDVLVNNAGFGLVGAVEEMAPDEYRPMFETNLFGLIEMTRAALPVMRLKAGGRIVQFSSVGGFTGRRGFGLYNAAKFAVEGLSEALAEEVKPFGMSVIIVEPGAFRTEFLGRSIGVARTRIAAYDVTSGQARDYRETNSGRQAGDPKRGVEVIIRAVDASNPPLRLPLGPDAHRRIRAKLIQVASDLDTWDGVATATNHSA